MPFRAKQNAGHMAGVFVCFCFRNSARRFFVPRLSAQPFNLLHMMPSMNPMKFSPLRRRQRTQNRMVQYFPRPKRASHCAMISSIAAIFSPTSALTFSTGKPRGTVCFGAFLP